jgi:hypothetical protein
MPKRAREILIEDELPLNSANTEFLYNKEDGALYYRDRLDAEWVSVLGEPGNDGDNGLSATIQVGSVTTGSPGSSAAVSNTGTTSAAVFNFTIPRGDAGPAGPAGPAGASAGFVEAIDIHNSDTTNVHGITDTSLLATKLYADNAASTAASTAVTNLIDSAPNALNTLNELAAALNDDANFSTTVTNALAGKLSIASASATYATKNELTQVEAIALLGL